jgi:hypothetical protein
MTDEELQEKVNALIEMFGGDLPNPEQEPRRFAYYVKLFKFYTERNEAND